MKTYGRFRAFSIVFLAAAILLAPGGSEGAPARDPLQELYTAAKAEGEVSFWGPTTPDEMNPLLGAFNRRFPGIKVKQFVITAGQMVERIVTEVQAGKVTDVDSAQSAVSVSLPLLDKNLVQGYDDWGKVFQGLKLNPNSICLGGRAITWYHSAHPIAYNTRLLKPEDVPKTWEDLLDPRWKDGRIIVEARAKAFAYLGLIWGEQKMVDYVRKFAAQKPIFTKGGPTALQQLASGEAPLALGTYEWQVLWYARDKKAPVNFIDTTSPMGGSHFVTLAFRGARHPNAAKLFVGWLATPEATKVLADVSFKGQFIPGSNSPVYKRFMKNNVELSLDSPDNARQTAQLERRAAEELGIVK